jgi:SAM-dependent methyltransferase
VNQALPNLVVDDMLDVAESNQKQQRGAHGAFRFFGKLAPDVTGRILDVARQLVGPKAQLLVDVMCGSGTTLVEGTARELRSIGCDINPVAALYATVKTSAVRADVVEDLLALLTVPSSPPSYDEIQSVFEATRNWTRWFTRGAASDVVSLHRAIRALRPGPEQRLLFAVLLSRLRAVSNASARTGRIFYDPASARDVRTDFLASVRAVVSKVPSRDLDAQVVLADARALPLPDETADISFCHPPYFGLYRFSADVLRFELEVGGWSRPAVNRHEVREGWKSGDVRNLDGYVTDMADVFREAHRVTRKAGVLVLVVSNSTLGDHQLPVVDRLAAAALSMGWSLELHLERKAHFGSATYHKSARNDKVIDRDHVLLLRRN